MLLSQNEIDNACSWLMEHAGPSIRYRTLTEIMHLDWNHSEVQKAYSEILSSKRFASILQRQNQDGSFGDKSFHGQDCSETYLRELFEMGVSPTHDVLKKGIEYAETLYKEKTDICGWIVGLLTEPIGRAGKNQLVIDWFYDYKEKFNDLYVHHRGDWLITKGGNPSTYYLEVPYIYVIRTISNSWYWLKEIENADISKILEFLLVDMCDVSFNM